MDPSIRAQVEQLLGRTVVGVTTRTGGYTASRCWSVEIGGEQRAFVKAGATDDLATTNRIEATVLAEAGAAPLPGLIAISDDGTVLITEDLSHGDWSPTIEEVGATIWPVIAEIGRVPGPDGLFTAFQGSGRDPWDGVVGDHRLAGAIGVDPRWLDHHHAALSEAAKRTDTSGDRLIHGDLGPGNWCRRPDGGWCFVDWASAHRGNPLVDDAIAADPGDPDQRPGALPAPAPGPARVRLVHGRQIRFRTAGRGLVGGASGRPSRPGGRHRRRPAAERPPARSGATTVTPTGQNPDRRTSSRSGCARDQVR